MGTAMQHPRINKKESTNNPFIIGKPRRSQSIQKGPKGLSPDSGECRAE